MCRVNHVLQIRPERVELVERVSFDSKHLIYFILHDLDWFTHDSGHPKVASVFRKQKGQIDFLNFKGLQPLVVIEGIVVADSLKVH
jgi:hypothetical protein